MAAMIPFTSTRASLTAPASRPAVCRRFLPEATGMDLGACAVAAGVLSAAAARPRRLRDFARPPLLLREPVALVDCGSGSTRALFFQDDGHSHVRASKSRWRGDPLAVALRDDLKLDGLLRLLKQELPSGPVMLGATAGVRQALQERSRSRAGRAETDQTPSKNIPKKHRKGGVLPPTTGWGALWHTPAAL